MNKSAQEGFVASPPVIIGAIVVVAIIVIGISSGALKFSGYVKTNDSGKTQENQSSPTPTEKPKTTVKLFGEPFVDAKKGFSISYPEGWKVKDDATAVAIYKQSETKGEGQGDALISVYAVPVGQYKDTKVSSIADVQKASISKEFSNVKFIGEKELKIGGLDAFEIDFTGDMRSEAVQVRYIVLKSSTSLYIIVGMANAAMWDDLKESIDASVQTFKLQ